MRGSGISEAAAKASAAETRALLQNPLLAPPAGGPGGRITDRGRKVIGISGEVRASRETARGAPCTPASSSSRFCAGVPPGRRPQGQHGGAAHVASRARPRREGHAPRAFRSRGEGAGIPRRRALHAARAVQPPPAAQGDASFLSLPIHGHAAATVVRAQPGAPHGRLAAYAGAPVVVTAVTAKPGAASRVYAGGTQVWADA